MADERLLTAATVRIRYVAAGRYGEGLARVLDLDVLYGSDQRKAQMNALKDYLLGLEELAWEASRKGDASFYLSYLTDDALAVASRGRFDKATVLVALADGGASETAVQINGLRLIHLSPNAVLLSYQATVTVAADGCNRGAVAGRRSPVGPLTFGVYATTVYVRRDGVWYAAFNQLTPIER